MSNKMKTTSERSLDLYLRAVAQTTAIVKGIKPDQWDNSTPCEEWNLRVLVNHVIGEHRWLEAIFSGETVASVGKAFDGDLTGDDPIAAYVDAGARAEAAINDEVLVAHHDVSIGDISGYDYLTQLFMDQLVHGWDIMRGSCQDVALDDELAAAAIPVAQEMVAYVGQGSVFGNTVDLASDAPKLGVLLGTVGRSLAWEPPADGIAR